MSNAPRWIYPLLGFFLFAATTACEKLTPQQAHFQRAYKAYNKGDFATSLLCLKPLVEAGHPAAQLLLAKMHANGQGVAEDHGKAELLRNLAAYQIYSKGDYAPGVLRPANAQLKAISERLDYYVGAMEDNKEHPQDLAQVLQGIGLKGVGEFQQFEGTQEADVPNLELNIPHEDPKSTHEKRPAEIQIAVVPTATDLPVSIPKTRPTRRNEQITLGIVRQAAEKGDPQAMTLLAAAYTHGFYGLTPNAELSAQWAQKAKDARRQKVFSSETDALEKAPIKELGGFLAAGIFLVALGIWFWRKPA